MSWDYPCDYIRFHMSVNSERKVSRRVLYTQCTLLKSNADAAWPSNIYFLFKERRRKKRSFSIQII